MRKILGVLAAVGTFLLLAIAMTTLVMFVLPVPLKPYATLATATVGYMTWDAVMFVCGEVYWLVRGDSL